MKRVIDSEESQQSQPMDDPAATTRQESENETMNEAKFDQLEHNSDKNDGDFDYYEQIKQDLADCVSEEEYKASPKRKKRKSKKKKKKSRKKSRKRHRKRRRKRSRRERGVKKKKVNQLEPDTSSVESSSEEDSDRIIIPDDKELFSRIPAQVSTQHLFEEVVYQRRLNRGFSENNKDFYPEEEYNELKDAHERKLLIRSLILEARYTKHFKKKNFKSKVYPTFRGKMNKSLKQMCNENLDQYHYEEGAYNGIESCVSVKPPLKYCDITGYRSRYTERRSGLRFYSCDVLKKAENLSEEAKSSYLDIRNAIQCIQ